MREGMRRLLLIFLSFLGVVSFGVLQAQAMIYVGDWTGNPLTCNILSFSNNASGNVAPVTNINGAATTLNDPQGVAVDASWIYVANYANNSIDVFPVNGTGNIVPTRSIQGNNTTLSGPFGLAVDTNWIYVANSNNQSIDVFPVNGTGNIAPTRSIQGSNTTLTSVTGLTIDGNWIYVTDTTADSVDVFPINGTGNIAPTRSIQGSNTTFDNPSGLAVDANWIYVADAWAGGSGTTPSILIFPINGTGNIAPDRSITGSNTTFYTPYNVAVDANWIYVANYGNGVLVFPINGTGNIAPTVSIDGSNTDISRPYGLAVTATNPQPSAATAVPTVNEWGMIIFSGLAGLGSIYVLRRQRKTER